MQSTTDKIVSHYIVGMKALYPWARGEQGEAIAKRGLEIGERAARAACAGTLKLEGQAWTDAVRASGFTGPITKKALAAHCNGAS